MPEFIAKPAAGPIVRALKGGAAYPIFSEGGSVRDWSGNGIHGTGNSGVTRANGRFGPCLDFNGSTGFVDLGNNLNPGLRDMTLACWIRIRNTGSSQWRGIQKRGTGNNGTVAGYRFNGGSNVLGGNAVPWNLSSTQIDAGDGSYAHMSTTDYNLGTDWHSIVTTWVNSTGTFKLYIDGVFRETANVVGTMAGKSITNSRNATLGAAWNSAGTVSQFLDGQMDAAIIEFRAWSDVQARDYHRDPFIAFRRRTNVGFYFQPTAGGRLLRLRRERATA